MSDERPAESASVESVSEESEFSSASVDSEPGPYECMGLQPYQFEPLASSDDSPDECDQAERPEDTNKLHDTSLWWVIIIATCFNFYVFMIRFRVNIHS